MVQNKKKIQNSTHAGWIDQEEIPGTVENANYANYAGTAYGVSSCGGTSTVWINGPTSTNGVSINGYRIFAQACEITLNTMRLNLGTNTQGANINIFGFNTSIYGSNRLELNGGQSIQIITGQVAHI